MKPAVSRPVAVLIALVAFLIIAALWHFTGPNSKLFRSRAAAAAAERTTEPPRPPAFKTTWPAIKGLKCFGGGLYMKQPGVDLAMVGLIAEEAGMRIVWVDNPASGFITLAPDDRPRLSPDNATLSKH